FKISRQLRSKLYPYTTLFRSSNVMTEERKYLPFEEVVRRFRNGEEIWVEDFEPLTASDVEEGGGYCGYMVGEYLSSPVGIDFGRSEEHTSELQSRENLVCRLL